MPHEVTFTPTIYHDYVEEHGFTTDIPAHALLFYAMSLNIVLEANMKKYGHEKTFKVEAENTMKSTETIYGINRTHLIKYWQDVDALFDKLNLRPIPIKVEYRFKSVLDVINKSPSLILPSDFNNQGLKH